MSPEVEIIKYLILSDERFEFRPASDCGSGDFDTFMRNQKLYLNQRLREIRANPPSRTKHDGRFRSMTEMRDAYTGRDRAIAYLESKLAFLQSGGEADEAMVLNYNDKGELTGFDVVKLD